jgi:hypothetical protein
MPTLHAALALPAVQLGVARRHHPPFERPWHQVASEYFLG